MSQQTEDGMPRGKKGSVDANGGGYTHPPVHSRCPPGTCGNKNGRPRGRRNVADLLKDTMNESVPVRSGNKTRKMPASEAMIRVLVSKAGQGDPPALRLVVDLLEMTGQTNAVTEEEREKRGMRLPRALTPKEWD